MAEITFKQLEGKLFEKITALSEFERDFKKLNKKFMTLESDIYVLISTALKLFHKHKIPMDGIVQIADLGIVSPKIFKVRKFACRSLKGKGAQSGIRVIYAYTEESDAIEFVELYYKGDKSVEDKSRILKHYKR